MPKRKGEDYERLHKKLKLIEKELQRNRKSKRARRVRVISSSSSSSRDSSARQSIPSDTMLPDLVSPEVNLDQILSPLVDQATMNLEENAENVGSNGLGTATANKGTLSTHETTEDTAPELDDEILQILGVDPTNVVKFGKDIQKDVALRFEHTATKGLSKEERKEITDKYLVPGNCKLVGAPALNPEIKVALSEMVIKRDKVISSKQALMASAISSLGEAISLVLSSKEKNNDLLRILMNTGRTLCDCQHNDSITRRNFIIYAVKKEMKDPLQNASIDDFLFGHNLTETLKTAKAINKSGAELKPIPPSRPSTSKQNLPSTSKNWRGSYPPRKQPTKMNSGPPATASPSTSGPRSGSSRQLRSALAPRTARAPPPPRR